MINRLGFDEFDRPCKDLYAMMLAFEVSKRSIDPDTKCGCVVTDSDGGILTTGYNGPPIGFIDENFPLNRPDKYWTMKHAESNAICIAAREGIRLRGGCFFVTGLPCVQCMGNIIQIKASRVVWGPLSTRMQSEEGYLDKYKLLLAGQTMRVERFKYDDGLISMKPEIKEILQGRPDFKLSL